MHLIYGVCVCSVYIYIYIYVCIIISIHCIFPNDIVIDDRTTEPRPVSLTLRDGPEGAVGCHVWNQQLLDLLR